MCNCDNGATIAYVHYALTWRNYTFGSINNAVIFSLFLSQHIRAAMEENRNVTSVQRILADVCANVTHEATNTRRHIDNLERDLKHADKIIECLYDALRCILHKISELNIDLSAVNSLTSRNIKFECMLKKCKDLYSTCSNKRHANLEVNIHCENRASNANCSRETAQDNTTFNSAANDRDKIAKRSRDRKFHKRDNKRRKINVAVQETPVSAIDDSRNAIQQNDHAIDAETTEAVSHICEVNDSNNVASTTSAFPTSTLPTIVSNTSIVPQDAYTYSIMLRDTIENTSLVNRLVNVDPHIGEITEEIQMMVSVKKYLFNTYNILMS